VFDPRVTDDGQLGGAAFDPAAQLVVARSNNRDLGP
jgi:hypothetical protein